MRYVGEITTTDTYKIGLYAWNGKFIVKVEAGNYEQTYKISEIDFSGSEADIRALFADEAFLKTILERFGQMHRDFMQVVQRFDDNSFEQL
ncbi:MAG: hypothetical protein ACK4GN_07665 [Runella sp.]